MVAPGEFENKTETMKEQRLFVGNLPNGTSESDLRKLFKKYNVSNVEIKRKNVLDQESIFAFVNVASNRLDSCKFYVTSSLHVICILYVSLSYRLTTIVGRFKRNWRTRMEQL